MPSVAIIGAGAAGIAAYARLRESGAPFDVVVLEAGRRIGGRVRSVEFGGSIVDLGGQWVHGERGNVVYETVKDMDLLGPSLNAYDDFTFYVSDGRMLDKAATDELFEIGGRILGDAEGAAAAPERTFGEYFVRRYNEGVAGTRPEVKELSGLVLRWFNKFFLCLDPAESWHDVPTVGAFAFKKYEGNQHLNWRDKGYATILDVLLKRFPNTSERLPFEDSLRLGKEVTRISWDAAPKVKLYCSDGSTFEADHCVVTVSLGVLQARLGTLFEPPLPASKSEAVANMSIGVANKILLRFPTRWWSDDLKGFSLCWTEEDAKRLAAEAPHFEPSLGGRSWLEDVFGFYPIDSHPRVLLGWVTGPLAGDVELLSDDAVIADCMYLLRRFTGGRYEIPEPEAVLRSKWKSDPHFNGSYSYHGVAGGVSATEELIRPVRSSLGKEVLLFAGEATHPTRFSTVDGAIETGRREADRLIALYE